MRKASRKDKLTVAKGLKIGLLEIGDLVTNVREHPLFLETHISYLSHGRLFECVCACGNVKLLSENVLRQGELKSCGCLKKTKRQDNYVKRKERADAIRERKILRFQLQLAMDKFHLLRTAPLDHRYEPGIEKAAAEIRKLRAMLAYASRKE